MRVSLGFAVAAFTLRPGALAAQVQPPPNPTIPSTPDVSVDHGPNTREFVASGCAEGFVTSAARQ
jgi:hypothetical protein